MNHVETITFSEQDINTKNIKRIIYSAVDAPDLVKVTHHYTFGLSVEEKEVWKIELEYRLTGTLVSHFYECFEDKKEFTDRVDALFLIVESEKMIEGSENKTITFSNEEVKVDDIRIVSYTVLPDTFYKEDDADGCPTGEEWEISLSLYEFQGDTHLLETFTVEEDFEKRKEEVFSLLDNEIKSNKIWVFNL